MSLKAPMWRYRDAATRRTSHVGVIRPAAAFRGNPGDVLVRILDVAGFAVDAVLRVDHEFWGAGLLDPFINASGAVTRRRSGKNVMLGLHL